MFTSYCIFVDRIVGRYCVLPFVAVLHWAGGGKWLGAFLLHGCCMAVAGLCWIVAEMWLGCRMAVSWLLLYVSCVVRPSFDRSFVRFDRSFVRSFRSLDGCFGTPLQESAWSHLAIGPL